MDINQMYPSKYLKADDIPTGQQLRLTIKQIVRETVGEGPAAEEKWCMYFHETQQGMVLNQTNAHTLSIQLGNETDHWIGHPVHLGVENVQFGSKFVPGIRVQSPPPQNTRPLDPIHAGPDTWPAQ
jgi:hypothetical protein